MVRRSLLTLLALGAIALPSLAATSEEELRSVFDKFVVAQNAHDVKAVEALLLDSPQFLWITRGTPIWGRTDALKRFESLYAGTWHLEADTEAFRVVLMQPSAAQIFVPINFSVGAPGQAAQSSLFLMNQVLVKTETGWKISSILPIPVPTLAK